MKVSVLGCGTWGSAVAQALADNGVEVTAWQRYENKSLEMESTRRHPILKDIEFNSNIFFTSDFDNAIVSGNIIILAVPSDAVREVILQASDKLTENSIIVNLAKGIENNTLMTMSQVIHIESGLKANQIVSLYGPSHAEEVVKKLPTTLVAGCVENNTSILIQELMSSDFLRIYTNDDILGVEIGGSLKNIMAIAAGVWLELSVNTFTAILSVSAFLYYIIIYSLLLKRYTVHNTVLGGIAGAAPPLIGWVAVTGEIGWVGIILFIVVFTWQPAHFWALALGLAEDYKKAGIPMLPVVRSETETKGQTLAWSMLTFVVTMGLGIAAELGTIYFIVAIIGGGGFIYVCWQLFRTPGITKAPLVFRYSTIYLAVLFAAIALDRILMS